METLDGKDRDGEYVLSEDEYGDEGGELDLEDDLELQQMLSKLDPEMKQKFENGEFDLDELKGLGLVPESDDDYGEEGEHEW